MSPPDRITVLTQPSSWSGTCKTDIHLCFCKYGCLDAEIAIGIFSVSKVTVELSLCQTTKTYGAAHLSCHSFLYSALYVGGSPSLRSRIIFGESVMVTPSTGGCMGPRAGLDVLEKRGITCSCREWNRDSPLVHPAAWCLYLSILYWNLAPRQTRTMYCTANNGRVECFQINRKAEAVLYRSVMASMSPTVLRV
jgi:hypothetical protein